VANKVIHFEVTGKDLPALQRFYSEVFDWKLDKTNTVDDYAFVREGQDIPGGIGAAPPGSNGNVTFYVKADDSADVLRRVEERGGHVIMPMTEVAPGTTIGLFADPEGHVIGLM
jgi:predicted enzyme related to lactoylglutathione lyase